MTEPAVNVIHVYPQPDQHRTFDMQDLNVIDEILDIQLPIQKIFLF